MTTYTVHFRNDAAFACHDIKASTPQEALALVRKLHADDGLDLWFEPYDITSDVNEIVVSDTDGNELAFWFNADMQLRLAARDLLAALEQAVTALNTAPRFKVPHLDSDSYRIAALCDQAIAKAKEGAQ